MPISDSSFSQASSRTSFGLFSGPEESQKGLEGLDDPAVEVFSEQVGVQLPHASGVSEIIRDDPLDLSARLDASLPLLDDDDEQDAALAERAALERPLAELLDALAVEGGDDAHAELDVEVGGSSFQHDDEGTSVGGRELAAPVLDMQRFASLIVGSFRRRA